ncbi:MAG: molybdopterin oxidoreductase family protein [Phototrophicaceae bacterium]
MSLTRKHYRACNLCEALCGIEIELEDDTIIAIRGDKNDPFSRGHICPKATALQDIYNDPNRLKHPIRRTTDGWEEISWDEAFTEVVQNLKAVQAEHGRDAVGIYLGNPNVHNTGAILYGAPFVRSLRTKNRFSATSVDQLPHHFASYFMLGHQLMLPIPDIDRTQHMLILGANPLQSNGSLMTAPDVKNRLKAIQARDGKIVVLDPRKTLTAQLADEHYFIKPSTDALFLMSFIHVLFAENLVSLGRLEPFIDGTEKIQALVQDFTPEAVAPITGISAENIRKIVKDFVYAESAVCYGRVGVSMQAFGGLCTWAINLINILTGNFDEEGGAMFTVPAFDVVGMTASSGQVGNYSRWTSRVRERPEFSGELPVSVLGEEMLTEGEGQIKAMVTMAGNPVLSTPNGTQLDEGFENLDFMVSIDIYINETTRHANIILPTTTGLETEHYDVVFHSLAVRNTAKFSEALFEPEDGQMHDWQILRELRIRMEEGSGRGGRPDIFTRFSPAQLIDLGLKYGPHDVRVRNLRDNPHGEDLGALTSVIPQRLIDKRIYLAPDEIIADVPRLQAELSSQIEASADGFDLLLIGRRHLRSNNSWMHNVKRLVRGKNRCTMMMNPDDAEKYALNEGDCVTVQSRVGQVDIPIEITEKMMQGVVSIPHGFGHNREDIQLDVASEYAGVSINDLTDDQRIDELTGNAAFSGVPVRVLGKV